MQDAQLPTIVGFIVSVVFQALKRFKWIDANDAVVKQVTVCVIAAVSVFAAKQWQFDQGTLMQAVGAAFMALATHKTVLVAPTAQKVNAGAAAKK